MIRHLLFWGMVSACSGPQSSPSAPTPHRELPDVVLVTLDTTRADRLGAYGYESAHTEHLDTLARSGRLYRRAYSPLPLTIPSHGSIFTGKYPPNLGIRANGDRELSASEHTLTEALADAGYITVASVAAFVTTRQWGFDQGFDQYFDAIPSGRDLWHAERPAEAVVDDVLAWRSAQAPDGPPRFAWLHLYDAHFPYLPPKPWLDEAEQRVYDGELAYIDDQVGRLVGAHKGRPTLFVIVGDHGEGLGAHSEISHGLFVYNATQHVPFFISGPGVEPGEIQEPVSLVDVAPTVLSILGLPALPVVDGRAVPGSEPKPVYLESYQLEQRFGVQAHRAVVWGDWKLIDLGRPELYRQEGSDPLEAHNVADENPEVVAQLRRLLDGFGFEAPQIDPAHPRTPALTAELEALGYMDGAFLGDRDGALPDPKDRLVLVRDVQRLEHLVLEQKHEEVGVLVEKLALQYPDVSEFQTRWAQILAMRGQTDQAIALMDRTLDKDPGNAVLLQGLAIALAKGQRYEEAAQRFQEASELMPFAPKLRVMAVVALLEAPNGQQKAMELAAAYLQEDPSDLGIAGVLGVMMVRKGNPSAGMPLLERAVVADKPERDVAFHVAASAAGAGQVERAQRMLRLELRHHPKNGPAAMALARIVGRGGDWTAQLVLVDAFLAPAPAQYGPSSLAPSPAMRADFLHVRAQALFNLKRYAQAQIALDEGLGLHPEHPELLLLGANLLWQSGEQDAAKLLFEKAKAAKMKWVKSDDQVGPAPKPAP